MEKINKSWFAVDAVFFIILIIFNVFFFSLGVFNASSWVSYFFIHLSFFLLVITPFLLKGKKTPAVFGNINQAFSGVYFFAALIAGLIFIFASMDIKIDTSVNVPNIEQLGELMGDAVPSVYLFAAKIAAKLAVAFLKNFTVVLTVQLLIAGLYLIILIINTAANERTAEALEIRQEQINYIKIASAKLKLLMDRVDNKEARRKVESVYDAVSTSPVKSHQDLVEIENRILHAINDLEKEIAANNNEKIITSAISLLSDVKERNILLKTIN
ncbi:MAG: hypothetical protein FWC22_01565 [Treponema sp.]|nr:hypothetical protein [Treponema sp.]